MFNKPSLMALDPSIGLSLPVSAFLSSREVMDHFDPGSHGSTFGGNPLAASVASKALDLLYEDNLINNSHELGLFFLKEKFYDLDSLIALRHYSQ